MKLSLGVCKTKHSIYITLIHMHFSIHDVNIGNYMVAIHTQISMLNYFAGNSSVSEKERSD